MQRYCLFILQPLDLITVPLDAFADEDENLAVGGTAFVFGDEMELVQQFFVDADGQAFNGQCDHLKTNILCVHFRRDMWYNIEIDIKCI